MVTAKHLCASNIYARVREGVGIVPPREIELHLLSSECGIPIYIHFPTGEREGNDPTLQIVVDGFAVRAWYIEAGGYLTKVTRENYLRHESTLYALGRVVDQFKRYNITDEDSLAEWAKSNMPWDQHTSAHDAFWSDVDNGVIKIEDTSTEGEG